ncbi:hypothetical protein Q4577_13555 [Marinovum sp. 2_MG-2023]|uniref:hypothetical protein n=1 Tax=Roseobacteraceae TaxID=2854170 RepID=UPI001FD2801E|nr:MULTISPECIES: hypothetical protein [Roseobacteraceae]MCJ7873777.1 hypothetical protein [Phaeobacter sp. J2-8]MDO6731054.1 hypothetical protein [Marinovum sp. 2_MG-2023]MDO6778551.1 hypothetical protein [Marinovum sp. 1_MG-2023]
MIRTALYAIALLLVPTVSLATGCEDQHQAMSCAEGSTWDAATRSCVEQVTS